MEEQILRAADERLSRRQWRVGHSFWELVEINQARVRVARRLVGREGNLFGIPVPFEQLEALVTGAAKGYYHESVCVPRDAKAQPDHIKAVPAVDGAEREAWEKAAQRRPAGVPAAGPHVQRGRSSSFRAAQDMAGGPGLVQVSRAFSTASDHVFVYLTDGTVLELDEASMRRLISAAWSIHALQPYLLERILW